jgi:hypoxanthine phosphoribosyltransferase
MKTQNVSWSDVNDHAHAIIQQIAVDDWKPEVVVGIARGGLYLALLLSNYYQIPLETVKLQLRDGDATYAATGIPPGRRVLVVDDINDTGATLIRVYEEMAQIWGLDIRSAVFYNNEASKFQDIDYTAITINKAAEDTWIIFPWESWWHQNRFA